MTSQAPGGYAYVDPDDTLVDYPIASLALAETLSDALGFGPSWTGGLPAAPAQSQRALCWTGQGLWELVYEQSGSWWYVGGPPLFGLAPADPGVFGGGFPLGPLLAIPKAGTYLARFGFEMWYPSGGGPSITVVVSVLLRPRAASKWASTWSVPIRSPTRPREPAHPAPLAM